MSLVFDEAESSLTRDLCRLTFELWCLSTEAQAVVAMRLLGMSGLWRVEADENSRMVMEKPISFAAATSAAVAAASVGKRPDEVMVAAMDPLRDKTSANARRLGKAGMRLSPFA